MTTTNNTERMAGGVLMTKLKRIAELIEYERPLTNVYIDSLISACLFFFCHGAASSFFILQYIYIYTYASKSIVVYVCMCVKVYREKYKDI